MVFRSYHRQDGFSLLEVCIAAGLLGTALIALAALFTLSIDANRTARYRTYSTILAQQKLEELRAGGGGPAAVAGIDFVDGSTLEPPAFGSGRDVYARRWWVEPLAGGPPGLMVMQVEVRPQASPALGGARLVTAVRAAP